MPDSDLKICAEANTVSAKEEQDIYQYIMQNKDGYYDDILAKESRWKIFYHLSEMRTSILNWYDFKKDASVLEIGAGFGAITGMLCRRARRVIAVEKSAMRAEAIRARYCNYTNLVVYTDNVEALELEEKFDYIFFLGACCDGAEGVQPEKQLENNIHLARKWLKETGILLLAVENYNGAKYQCGYPRPLLGSINENGCEAMATKAQLQKMVEKAGFTHIKFYYPFPDYKLTQEVYSDEKFPEGSVRDRVLTYYVLPDRLTGNEYRLYEKEIAEGDIREICNSYLVECSDAVLHSDADYIAISTDRGREHSFATVIKKTQVVKTAIYEEGEKYLRQSYDNILNLQATGIRIVPHDYLEGRLIMPLVRRPKLVDRFFSLAVKSKEEFIQAVDKLYHCILKSSGSVEKDGEIYLESGYIDLVPLNCFEDGGEYYFFDQEFCEKDCPLNYIMFRALRYTYLSYPVIETYVSLEEMKERYGLQKQWQSYLSKEDDFIWENRQHRVNHSFYEWIANGVV